MARRSTIIADGIIKYSDYNAAVLNPIANVIDVAFIGKRKLPENEVRKF
jgi:hypothetical protein